MRWALEVLAIDPLTVSRIVAGLGASWRTVNDAVLVEGKTLMRELVTSICRGVRSALSRAPNGRRTRAVRGL
ncbi:hypothetical protein ABXS69_08465 [Actinomyces timonensis]|uniref:Transposase and inactivated derivatives n=1 Tax=Actinomyces timonensis TaxID=1288391 RepID=A0AAU8N2I7_9ACTO